MKHKIDEVIRKYVNDEGGRADFFSQLWLHTDDTTKLIIRHHYSGGSYKSAQTKFNMSPETYYRRIRKFRETFLSAFFDLHFMTNSL